MEIHKNPSAEKTLLLIDTHALLHRFFHALPPLTTPDGDPIQAIYGLSGVLLKILEERKPEFVAAAFDTPEKTFREERFKDYKIHRPPTAPELIRQLVRAEEVFTVFKIKTFRAHGFEADDVIGTFAARFAGERVTVEILSGDLDLLQLVRDGRVAVLITKTGLTSIDVYHEKEVRERYGLSPSALRDYKGLVGDTSDNIPGVKGVGPKTARELITEFKSLEGIFENLVIISEKIRKKLAGAKEIAFLSRELSTIVTNVPLSTPALEELARKPLDVPALSAYFASLGFRTLVERLNARP